MINFADTVARELRVVDHDVIDVAVRVRNSPDIDGLGSATEPDVDRREMFAPGQRMQCAVRRRCDRYIPTRRAECVRQIADDVTDTAYLARGQGAVLCSKEND